MRLIPHFSTVALVVVDTVRINLTSVSYRRFSSNYFRIADKIGIGAAVTHRPLPHHRAYGSVHGGSRWLRRHFLEQ